MNKLINICHDIKLNNLTSCGFYVRGDKKSVNISNLMQTRIGQRRRGSHDMAEYQLII